MFEVVPNMDFIQDTYPNLRFKFFFKSNSCWLIHTKKLRLKFQICRDIRTRTHRKIPVPYKFTDTYGNSLWSKKKLKGAKNML